MTVLISDGTAAPSYVDQGIPYDDGGAVAVDDGGVIDHYHQGLPFTAASRLAAAIDGIVDYISSSAPFTATGLLAFGTGVVDHYSAGIAYTATQQIKAGGSAPPPTREVLTFQTDSWGTITSTFTAGDFNLALSFTVAVDNLNQDICSQAAGAFTSRLTITSAGGISCRVGSGSTTASVATGLITPGTKQDIIWARTGTTVTVTLDATEIINYEETQALTMGAFGDGGNRFVGIIQDITFTDAAGTYVWALDSGSVVSEDSTGDANTMVFTGVEAADWSTE